MATGLILFAGCSNLFETYEDSLEAQKSFSSSSNSGGSSSSANNPSGNIVPINSKNEEAAETISPQEGSSSSSKSRTLDSGIVVIKSSAPTVNQIFFNSSHTEYSVGHDSNDSSLNTYASYTYLYPKDTWATVEVRPDLTPDSKKIDFAAVQTYAADENGTLTASAENPSVAFTQEGNKIKFTELPYGTTKVTIPLAEKTYTVNLTRLYGTDLYIEKDAELYSGLAVLKESDGFNKNQVSYTSGVSDYRVGYISGAEDFDELSKEASSKYGTASLLTGSDSAVYLKLVPGDTSATITWTAERLAKPVYSYTYVIAKTTTVMKISEDGSISSNSSSTTYSSKNSEPSASEVAGTNESVTNSDGSTTYTSVSYTVRKTISGISGLEALDEGDSSEITLNADSANNTDRVRVTNLPYGLSLVKATVTNGSYSQTYTISLIKTGISESADSSSAEKLAAADETSKLSEMTISTDSDSPVEINFSKDKDVYSVSLDENVDEITINTKSDSNVKVENFTQVSKYSSLTTYENNSVSLLGGLQVITFTVTEEGCESRTYTIYAYKATGNTVLESISIGAKTGFAKSNGKYSSESFASIGSASQESELAANFDRGTSSLAKIQDKNGGSIDSPIEYTMTVSADNRANVESLALTAVPKDSYTSVSFYVGSDPANATWTSSLTKAQAEAKSSGSSDSDYAISSILNDSGKSGETHFWIKTTSRVYDHGSERPDSNGNTKYSDVTYHKVTVNKAGSESTGFTALMGYTMAENAGEYSAGSSMSSYSSTAVAYTPSMEDESWSVTTDIDSVKIFFRLLNSDSSHKVYYSVTNSRYQSYDSEKAETGWTSSLTEITAGSQSPSLESGSNASDISAQCASSETAESSSALEYYTITIGSNDKDTDVSAARADLQPGTTTVSIYVDGTKTPVKTISIVKPDLDTTNMTVNNTVTGNGSGGSVSYRDSIIYISGNIYSLNLSLKTYQENEEITVENGGYVLKSGENGESLASGAQTNYMNCIESQPQRSESSKTSWTSTIGSETNQIPAGTSVITYTVWNKNKTTSKTFTVTIIKSANSEVRLSALSLHPSASTASIISGFEKNSIGTAESSSPKAYYNSYTTSKDGETGTEYTFSATAANASANVTATVLRNTDSSAGYDYASPANSSTEWSDFATASGTGTVSGSFTTTDAAAIYILKVTVSVAQYKHSYYVRMGVPYDIKAEVGVSINQFASDESTASYSLTPAKSDLDYDEGSEKSYTTATNLDYVGAIVLTGEKSPKATWKSLSVSGSGISSSDYEIDESSAKVTLFSSIYKNYAGKEISVTFAATSESGTVTTRKTYVISVSELKETTVTEKNMTFKTKQGTEVFYTTSADGYKNQLGFQIGSKVLDESNPIQISASGNGGIDIIGSTDSGISWGVSSYNFSGLQYFIKKGGELYLAKLESEDSTSAKATAFYKVTKSGSGYTGETSFTKVDLPDVNLTVKASIKYDGTDKNSAKPYLSLTHAVTGADRLGAVMDTLVGPTSKATDAEADSVTVSKTNNGFAMKGDGYTFKLYLKDASGVDNVSRSWYGAYTTGTEYNYFRTVFDDEVSSLSVGTDSALSFSWDDLSSTETKSIRLSVQ